MPGITAVSHLQACIIDLIPNPQPQVPSLNQPLQRKNILNCPLFIHVNTKPYQILKMRVTPTSLNVRRSPLLNVYGCILTCSSITHSWDFEPVFDFISTVVTV